MKRARPRPLRFRVDEGLALMAEVSLPHPGWTVPEACRTVLTIQSSARRRMSYSPSSEEKCRRPGLPSQADACQRVAALRSGPNPSKPRAGVGGRGGDGGRRGVVERRGRVREKGVSGKDEGVSGEDERVSGEDGRGSVVDGRVRRAEGGVRSIEGRVGAVDRRVWVDRRSPGTMAARGWDARPGRDWKRSELESSRGGSGMKGVVLGRWKGESDRQRARSARSTTESGLKTAGFGVKKAQLGAQKARSRLSRGGFRTSMGGSGQKMVESGLKTASSGLKTAGSGLKMAGFGGKTAGWGAKKARRVRLRERGATRVAGNAPRGAP